MALAGCAEDPEYSEAVSSSSLFDDMLKPGIEITEGSKPKTLADQSIGISPGTPISVKATEGAVTRVNIDKADGSPVKGKLVDGVWTINEPLGYSKTYTLKASAVGVGGTSSKSVSFTTSAPNMLTQAYLTPSRGEEVGIAQPVAVKFDEAIPNRKAAQNAIRITTTPRVEGAFYWISDSEVRWRPENYWKPGTKVSVKVNTYGVNLGDGLFGQENVSTNFTIGRSMVITADDKTKMVTFRRNGEVIKEMPTSMGKPGSETDNGIYIVADKHEHIVMDSSTYGVPINSADGYRTPVDYATRMSYSGIFFHAAPWSVWAQGNTNTSHGCLNLSPADAKWVMDNTFRGDPVEVRNTSGQTLSGTDGLGDWNIAWSTWSAGNA
ncbi:L,D-transpeptidase family protein [Gordonia pseudamarae]|uniref:L,D-transpeptidase family protein n=2 Tax=Gordonia pseudamarae TaxID=2831662 RepID=A0ABX6IQ07_9ACTN|nr:MULTISPECIES: Ig-like domain-containing protein [Gordonia]MBD0023549.1 L,D-transpeptidase [Gordonia sp. (in: high G+C Gram-positive bacteria)]QHN28570.1 L,D-transpeptidase family protein [Gordonia pseudamarae]QHN37439.1 L,D-transpeptidase family protein [Gordonia pseudamarae]